MIPDLDRVVDSSYLAGLADRSTEDLRRMRAECTDLENGLSYVRRLAQGRLDLMVAEQGRRSSGSGGNAADLVAQLPDLLSEGVRGEGSGRVNGDLEPPEEVVGPLTERLDSVVGPGAITGLPDLEDTALSAGIAALRDFEARLSETRRSVHSTVDSINDELAQRYRTGETPAAD